MRRLLLVLALLLSLPAFSASGPLRVACLGDSLTAGDGDDQGQGYPGRLQARLPAGTQVKNLGRSGWTSEMMVQGYEGKPSQVKQALAWKPQVALIWIGSNDLWYLYEYNNPGPEQEKADLARFRKNLEDSIRQLRQAGCQVVLALLDDQSKRPVAIKGEAFTGISRAELQRMSRQVQAYNQVLRQLARKNALQTVDFSSGDLFRNPATLNEDGNHPNSRGYDEIAARWLASLTR